MTNREYFTQITDELFDMSHKTEAQLLKNKKYLEFEKDVEQIIRNDFSRIGCDTSVGEPTELGMLLWLNSTVRDSTIELIERKYRMVQ